MKRAKLLSLQISPLAKSVQHRFRTSSGVEKKN